MPAATRPTISQPKPGAAIGILKIQRQPGARERSQQLGSGLRRGNALLLGKPDRADRQVTSFGERDLVPIEQRARRLDVCWGHGIAQWLG